MLGTLEILMLCLLGVIAFRVLFLRRGHQVSLLVPFLAALMIDLPRTVSHDNIEITHLVTTPPITNIHIVNSSIGDRETVSSIPANESYKP